MLVIVGRIRQQHLNTLVLTMKASVHSLIFYFKNEHRPIHMSVVTQGLGHSPADIVQLRRGELALMAKTLQEHLQAGEAICSFLFVDHFFKLRK